MQKSYRQSRFAACQWFKMWSADPVRMGGVQINNCPIFKRETLLF